MVHRIGRTPQLVQPTGNRAEEVRGLGRSIYIDSTDIRARVVDLLPKDGSEAMTGPLVLWNTSAPFPAASGFEGGLLYDALNNVFMFSDGSRWASDPWVFNVRDYGAIGDGTTDDTTAIQAAIAAADAFAATVAPVWSGQGSAAVYFPRGAYVVTGIDTTKPHTYYGDGENVTWIELADDSDVSVWTHTLAGDAGGPDADTQYYMLPLIHSLSINGNSANQVGTCFGIYFPSTAWTAVTAYSVSAIMRDVLIVDCLDAGVFIGENRGAGKFFGITSIYSGRGFENYAYDNHFYSCNGGACEYGYASQAAGGTVLVACNFYLNTEAGFIVNAATNAYIWYYGGSLDLNEKYGLIIDGDGQQHMSYSFVNTRFSDVGTSAANTYPHIHATDVYGLSVVGSTFHEFGTNSAKHLIEFVGTNGFVYWIGNDYRTDAGNEPWGTSLTDDFTRLVFGGDRDIQVTRNSVGDMILTTVQDDTHVRIKGTPTDNDATAGHYGEFLEDANFTVPLTTATTANIADITLTPGDWDVTGSVVFLPENTTTTTQAGLSISTTSATHDFTIGGYAYTINDGTGITGTTLFGGHTIGPRRFSINANTTVYLTAVSVFSGGDMDASGTIRARRVR